MELLTLDIKTGNGNDSLTLLKTTVDGKSAIKMSGGDDYLLTVLSSFFDDVSINTAKHDDTILFVSTFFGDDDNHELNIITSKGEDYVAFIGVPEFVFDCDIGFDIPPFVVIDAPTFADTVNIKMDIGDDTVVVGDCAFIDNLNLNMGKHDNVLIVHVDIPNIANLNFIGAEPIVVETDFPEFEAIDEVIGYLTDFFGRGGDVFALIECFIIVDAF